VVVAFHTVAVVAAVVAPVVAPDTTKNRPQASVFQSPRLLHLWILRSGCALRPAHPPMLSSPVRLPSSRL